MKHNVRTSVDAIEMQMELADLRKRVKILDGNTGRNELLNKLREREEENKREEDMEIQGRKCARFCLCKLQEIHMGWYGSQIRGTESICLIPLSKRGESALGEILYTGSCPYPEGILEAYV